MSTSIERDLEALESVTSMLSAEARVAFATVLASWPEDDVKRYVAIVRSSADLSRGYSLTVRLDYVAVNSYSLANPHAAEEILHQQGFSVKTKVGMTWKLHAVLNNVPLFLLPFKIQLCRELASATSGHFMKWRV